MLKILPEKNYEDSWGVLVVGVGWGDTSKKGDLGLISALPPK